MKKFLLPILLLASTAASADTTINGPVTYGSGFHITGAKVNSDTLTLSTGPLNVGDCSDARIAVFGTLTGCLGAITTQNGTLFSAVQTSTAGPQSAVITLGHLPVAMNRHYIVPFYSECALDTTTGGLCSSEIDTFSKTAPTTGSGGPVRGSNGSITETLPIGLTFAAATRTGYTQNSYAATQVATNGAQFYLGHLVNTEALIPGGAAFALSHGSIGAGGTFPFYVDAGGSIFSTPVTPGTAAVFDSGDLGAADTTPALFVKGTSTDKSAGATIVMYNTGAGVATPVKYFRINSSGAYEILSSSYGIIASFSDSGALRLPGLVTAANCTGQPSKSIIATTGTGALVQCP
jgi:hypothetical protein